MNVTILVDAIVRQTTVLIAQLATGTGRRATLAHTANQIFASLVRELRTQGVSNKGIADMFGLSLRTFHNRVSRLSESKTERGHSLWEALYTHIEKRGPVTRAEVLQRFSADDDTLVRGVLRELVESGLVFRSGAGDSTFFRVARPDEYPQADAAEKLERLASMLWVAVKRYGPVTRDALAEIVPAREREMDDALARLIADGRIEAQQENGEPAYVTQEFLIPVGSSVGWEAAVFDHYQALVTTITTKLRLSGRHSAPDDWVGGSTYSIELTREHALFEEVVGFLRSTRERAVALRRRVEELKRQLPEQSGTALNVIIYVGQTVVGLENEEEQ